MSLEPKKIPEKDFGALQGCLVEGDPAQRARERRIKRRSLVISVTLQGAVLAAIVLIPLFGRTERIAANVTPVPPYFASRNPVRSDTRSLPPLGHKKFVPCLYCPPTHIPDHTVTTLDEVTDPGELRDPNTPVGGGSGPCPGCIALDHAEPVPPKTIETVVQPHRVHLSSIDPAMLKRRIEPIYPPLAIQIHKEGRVELHAIIDTDGRIQSLQIVEGDPLFYSSAMAAVQQWIYKPTFLNGQPVQVDTTITVIYSMQH
jgi:protein TonB